jgi:hypothetical protein
MSMNGWWYPTSNIRSRILLDKILGPRLVNKYSAFGGTRTLIAMFTKTHRCLSPHEDVWRQPSKPVSLRSVLILSSSPHLDLPSSLIPLGFSPQTLYAFLFPSHFCTIPQLLRTLWCDYPNNIWWWVNIMKLLIVQLYPSFYYFLPLVSKYLSQNPVLEIPSHCFSFNFRDQISYQYKTTGRICLCESDYECLGFIRQYFFTSCSRKTFHQEISLLDVSGLMVVVTWYIIAKEGLMKYVRRDITC